MLNQTGITLDMNKRKRSKYAFELKKNFFLWGEYFSG